MNTPTIPASELQRANRERNDGKLIDEYTGKEVQPAQQSKKGVTPLDDEAAIDHRIPRAKDGDNSYDNLRVTSRGYHRRKAARMPTEQEK